MSNIAAAKAALQSEIIFLAGEQSRLARILASLDAGSGAASVPDVESTGKRRGRKPGSKSKAAKEAAHKGADALAPAIELIKTAGKGGIKALKLAFELKKDGLGKVGKVELLDTGKVKMSGKGGGSTYSYVG